MKMKSLSVALAFAVGAVLCGRGFAEEAKPAAPAAAQPAEAPKPAEAAKPAAPEAATKPAATADGKKPGAKPAQPKVEVMGEVMGKVETKQVKNKKGTMMPVNFVTVASAKSADGKELAALKGKSLRITGKKGVNVKSFVGKDVTINGTITNNRRITVDTIK